MHIILKFSNIYNNDLGKKAASNHSHTFASITSKPTTLSGYGITDAASSGHSHNMTALNYDYSIGNINGYNGKYMKITYKNNVKEEYNYAHFTNVPFTQGYGNLFYNQSYVVPLFNTYTTIYGVEMNVACNNGLMGATFINTSKITSGVNNGKTGINYWLYSSKSGTFDITIYYHVIGS